MGPAVSDRPGRTEMPALLAMLAAVFAWLLQRNLGLYPAIFADEWYYSKMARLLPLREAMLPSYLYLWLFGGSTACGPGFLDCVRIGNALFFVAAAPFVYLVARRVAGPGLSLLVTLAALLAPLNMYTAFFMPESMYCFGFWVLSWLALARGAWPWPRHALATGTVLGLMSLVKVHALFLLPALFLFLVYAARARAAGGAWLRRGLLAGGLGALAAFAVKFGLGWLLAGPAAFGLFGPLYSETSGALAQRPALALLQPAFVSGRGHAMALAVLLAFPLALLGQALCSRAARARAGPRRTALHLYTLLMLAAAVGMTVAYTASIAHLAPLEVVRLHQRYYSFAFPLLFIAAAAAVGQAGDGRPAPAWPVALPIVAVLLLALAKLPLYPSNAIDGPDIASLDLRGLPGWLVVGLELLILFLWARSSRFAAPLFLFAALPAMLWAGVLCTDAYLRQLVPGWGPDEAGLAARRFVPAPERKRIAVAGTLDQDIMRAQFQIDDKDVAALKLAPGAPLRPDQVPTQASWLVVLGRHALPAGIEPLVATADYALARLYPVAPRTGMASLSQPFGPGGLLASASGLSGAEAWGRWSDATRVVLRFNAPLPPRCVLRLRAHAFGANVGQPFTLHVGAQAARFRLGPGDGNVDLAFAPGSGQHTVAIDVPRPQSPAELGQSADTRRLGIGIAQIAVDAVAPATLVSTD